MLNKTQIRLLSCFILSKSKRKAFRKKHLDILKASSFNPTIHFGKNVEIAHGVMLEENINIGDYSYIKENSLLREYDSWWLAQIETTVSYYVYGSRPALIKLYKIYKWCRKHSDSKSDIKRIFKKYNAYLIDYNICDFKVAIKRLLGRI